jgi:preprotein translocase subunit SecA
MFSLFNLFDSQKKTLGRYGSVVAAINSFEPALKKLSDAKLRAKTAEFKKRLAQGESLEKLLPEAYALVREAGRRALGLRHFDVQLMAGIAFHEGKVAEQKTGEGKTLSATLPLYLNALEGKGAHLVTVNDYLSQIGAGWMGPLYHALDLSVGVIIHDQSFIYDPDFHGEQRGDDRLEHFRPVPRQEAYGADITYGTNNEFGFDYLRDNMAQRLRDQVQRGHHFAIVDEADSILIDEARTPLIISAPDSEPTEKYRQFAQLVKQMTPGADYVVDEKMRTAVLTDLGVKRLERQLSVTNLYEESFDTIHHVEQALKAHSIFQRDKDYVVREGEVVIVDEHTGRLMFGRRYSDGLHQAIEAKEAVTVQQESRTLATISLQNYFRQYAKLSGMSGTALTEAEEFQKIYGMDVLSIPTNMPVNRVDNSDVVYKTLRAKYAAIVAEIEAVHQAGQPILLGTRSIDQNQIIAKLLQRKNIPHQVLNAKNHEREAFIIAAAGRPGAITVATNIAGRGVDIVLGGAKPDRLETDSDKDYEKTVRQWQKDHDEVVAKGGLHIIGTERHESRRIDNQLRGRAGRQGDPGSSRFFISLEDEIMRIFGGEQISKLMDLMRIDENMPIEHALIAKAISQAQIKVEGFFFDQRKNLVEYDDVMNRQREVIYQRRQHLLEMMARAQEKDESSAELSDRLRENFRRHFQTFIESRLAEGLSEEESQNLVTEFSSIIPFESKSLELLRAQIAKRSNTAEILEFLEKVYADTYKLRQDALGQPVMREIELFVFLSAIDEQWMNHLDDMTNLRDSIWLRGSKEQALAEYKKEAFQLFSAMIARIELEALKRVFRVNVQTAPPTPVPQKLQTSGPSEELSSLAKAMSGLDQDMAAIETGMPVGKKAKKAKKARKKSGSYL